MNKTSTPTEAKIMIPLRLPPEVYRKMVERVRDKKDNDTRAYSVNQYLTELIAKDVKVKL